MSETYACSGLFAFRLFSIQDVQFLARFEADSFAGRNVHFGSGPRVATDACLSRPHIEDAKATKLDAISVGQGFFQALKNGVDCSFGFYARQTGPFDHVMDDVLFNQCLHSETLMMFWLLPVLV